MPTYEYMRHQLQLAFANRYQSQSEHPVRLVGIIFGRPESKLAKEDVLQHLNYLNLRSEDHIDFFCAGYYNRVLPEDKYTDRRLVVRLDNKDWFFSDKLYLELRKDIKSKTKWNYSGGTDLILTNAKYDRATSKADLDFSTAIAINLDQAKEDKLFLSTEMFFEKIITFAENQKGDDPAWGLSDYLGLRVAGSALKSVVFRGYKE